MMNKNIKIFGNEYTVEEALAKAQSHSSWLFWIAGLTAINLVYSLFAQDYFMVAGLGLDSFIASFLASSEDQFYTLQTILAVGFIAFFLVTGYIAQKASIASIAAGTVVYALDSVLFITVYFDFVSFAFHAWATISLIAGMIYLFNIRGMEPVVESS